MEIRTLQKIGGSSYSLTLPKVWVVKNQLQTHGTVQIHAQDTDHLVIVPHQPKKIYTANLRIDYLSGSHIIREILGKYISGVDELMIISNPVTYEQRNLIRNLSYKLMGFELFEESSDWILLKNVTNPNISAAEYIKKMVRIIQSMYSDMVKTVEVRDQKLALDIIGRDVEVDRIHLVIIRQFNLLLKNIVSDNPNELNITDLHYYELVGIRLERLADHIVRIALTISRLGEKDIITLNKFEHADLIKINDYLKSLPKIIFEHDKAEAHIVLDLYESRAKNDYISRTIIKKHPINILIQDSVERIRSYISNIAEETINYYNLEM